MPSIKKIFMEVFSEIEKEYEVTVTKRLNCVSQAYTVEELDALGVFPLRNLARDLGVRSRQTRKKGC